MSELDLPDAPLARHVRGRRDPDALLEGILAWAEEKKLALYPAQEEAILELCAGKHVILATPTGSGKSLVASALHAKALAEGTRSFYTAPIKALVSEKFFAMCKELGARNVGLMTGDASVNRDAPVICCTAEILANLALRDGDRAGVASVVMDEFHYYGDRDRGAAWQIPLISLSETQFLLMSGTLGDVTFFEKDLHARTGKEVVTIRAVQRPVPLEWEYRETPILETLAELLEKDRAPVYVVHFTQRAAAERAQDLMSTEVVDKERKQKIKDELVGFRWDSPYGKDLQRYVRHGVGVHHAGLLPKYRLMIEKLAQKGLLSVICGTDTLGVGINVPIRSVVFTQLCKFDGQKTSILSVRDFHQIAGRAGRRGFDDRGWVLIQAPEHVIENKVARDKAAHDPKKLKKLVARKPPDRGYAHWDEGTFERLKTGEPERLESRFRVSTSMIMQLLEGALERGEHGCGAIETIIRESHESRTRKFNHGRHAIALFRSLLAAEIVHIDREAGLIRVEEQLQRDFSLNQALSLFVIDTIPKLSREDPLYALDILTLVEAIVEDPSVVLQKQLDRLKDLKMSEMKADGLEYEERMTELEKVENPKPRIELLEPAFEEFGKKNPWVPREDLRPKSIARDMYERSASFADYVKEYGLQRSEGVLLRYLSDVYKTFAQTVPEPDKTDEVFDVSEWLRAVVKQVDSSLLDEWESLKDPSKALERANQTDLVTPPADDITQDKKAFTALVRNAMFRMVRLLAHKQYDQAAALAEAAPGKPQWTVEELEARMMEFEEERGVLRIDPAARAPKHLRIEEREGYWRVEQTLVDDEEDCDWMIEANIDLARARELGGPMVELLAIGRL